MHIRASSREQGYYSEKQDRGRKMSGKSVTMMENGVMRTAEETHQDEENGSGREAG